MYPLRNPLILYTDDSSESREAQTLLESVGISPFLIHDPVEPGQRNPLVIYTGGEYQGLERIRGLVNLLEFWSTQPIDHRIFTDVNDATTERSTF